MWSTMDYCTFSVKALEVSYHHIEHTAHSVSVTFYLWTSLYTEVCYTKVPIGHVDYKNAVSAGETGSTDYTLAKVPGQIF